MGVRGAGSRASAWGEPQVGGSPAPPSLRRHCLVSNHSGLQPPRPPASQPTGSKRGVFRWLITPLPRTGRVPAEAMGWQRCFTPNVPPSGPELQFTSLTSSYPGDGTGQSWITKGIVAAEPRSCHGSSPRMTPSPPPFGFQPHPRCVPLPGGGGGDDARLLIVQTKGKRRKRLLILIRSYRSVWVTWRGGLPRQELCFSKWDCLLLPHGNPGLGPHLAVSASPPENQPLLPGCGRGAGRAPAKGEQLFPTWPHGTTNPTLPCHSHWGGWGL